MVTTEETKWSGVWLHHEDGMWWIMAAGDTRDDRGYIEEEHFAGSVKPDDRLVDSWVKTFILEE